MKVHIDESRCSGHGRCYATAPELFVDDERGFGQVRGDGFVSPELADAARLAAQSCPEGAVVVIDA